MDAIFIDSKGNKKNFLYQYDKGQTFVVENFEYSKAPKAHFSIKSIKTAPSVSSRIVDGDLHVSIPDILLAYGENIVAYLYIEDSLIGNTVETIFISVIPRKRPADYVYSEEMFARSINGTLIANNLGVVDVATWADGNTDNRDRSGYFASISYNNINKNLVVSRATSLNDVYGVIVNEAGVATNCDEDKLDKSGNLLPKYAYVCTSGFAKVIDNGACTVGGTCMPNSSGIAIQSDNAIGYKVVYRVDNNHILIFVDQSMHTIKNMLEHSNNISDTLNAHKNDKTNPHSVTKSQVGLSNVPNVSTNNQTPTYTEESTLSAMTSGEKLSSAFGKISKAVTDLIAHIANKSNPHEVTKAQVGLDNVDNTSDVNKPISTATKTALDKKADLVDGIVPMSQLPTSLYPDAHADTHKTGGSDAISPASIGAVSQADFDALKEQVEELADFIEGIKNADVNQY